MTTSQRLTICNRAPAAASDGWIHIVPRGELPNPEAGLVQVLDDAALDSILRNIATEKARLGSRWPGVYAGREHFIYDAAKDSEALAWFKEFEKRSDGIWAKADGLTDVGREAIQNGRYKWTSFTANRSDLQMVGGNRARVLKIDTVGFTNAANGKELLAPVTNRGTAVSEPKAAAEEMLRRANDIKQQKGVSFDTAWSMARSQNHELEAVMLTGSAPLANRQQSEDVPPLRLDARAANAELTRICNRLKSENGWTFDQAWNHARSIEPLVFAMAHLPPNGDHLVINRVPGFTEEDLWKIIRKVQSDVKERIFRELDNYIEEPIVLERNKGPSATTEFLSGLKKSMQQQNGDFDVAWSELQRSDPALFGQFILETDEARELL
jgi:hypothetical protein